MTYRSLENNPQQQGMLLVAEFVHKLYSILTACGMTHQDYALHVDQDQIRTSHRVTPRCSVDAALHTFDANSIFKLSIKRCISSASLSRLETPKPWYEDDKRGCTRHLLRRITLSIAARYFST